ncbi:MAG: lytic transglycosylase [Desulfobulbus sp.]|nr:MAG: lytic transglycosylase [Desulfobulbus sp.]
MKPKLHIIFPFFLLLLSGLITACSSTHTALVTNPAQLQGTSSEEPIDQSLLVEPEEVLNEELTALDRTGAWTDGQTETITQVEPEVIFDFPITINRQVEFYLNIFQNRQRRYFQRWLARSGKYLPYIQKKFHQAGLPRDLAYLAMIESGFNPSAYSRAGAVGLWQFMKTTGRNYGLRVNRWIDERRDPEKATMAAIAYLAALHSEFGDWYLAVASYNAGEGKIRQGIKRYKTRDFWQLAHHKFLRLETKRYVPKLIAAIMIAREPEKYGFTDINYQLPVPYDLVTVPARTDLAAVAAAAKTELRTIRELNNALRRNQTPPNPEKYQVKVPRGSRSLVVQNLQRLHPVVTTGWKTHIVRRGDTLTRICRRYRLNKKTLLKANNLHTARLRRGRHLRIPYRTTRYVLLKKGETMAGGYARSGKNTPLILHQLKKGETLSKISKQYQVPVALIKQWNDIKNVRRIRVGQQIALYVDRPGYRNTSRKSTPSSGPHFLILTDAKKQKPEDDDADYELTWYKVRNGDSIWTIARRFRVSATDIRRWNNLRSNLIHPGRKLVVKKV